MTEVADPAGSRVVLIGVPTHSRLPHLPAIANNVVDLLGLLQDPKLWGIPPENCHTIVDPHDPAAVSRLLRAAADATEPGGLLLVYYAGHGLIDPDNGRLILALPDCDPEFPHEDGLPYDWVRKAVAEASASRRVVILDCCYSGRASAEMGEGTTGTDAVADLAESSGTCLLVSAPANRASTAPHGETYTAFTGELIRLLRTGQRPQTEPAPPALTVQNIWRDVRRAMERRGLERPEIRASNAGGSIALVHNVAAVRNNLAGAVLFAAPATDDADLAQQGVLVLRHNETGALAVRITRPGGTLPASFPQSWRPLVSDPARLFDGGPVAQDGDGYIVVTLLHRGAEPPMRFTRIRDRLGTVALSALPEDLSTAVDRMRVFVGYLGWQAGELEEFLDKGALIPSRRTALQIFTERPELLWRNHRVLG